MKKILTILLVSLVLVFIAYTVYESYKSRTAYEKALVVVEGKFAFCGASAAKPTGKRITVEGREFWEGVAACPVMDGPSIANNILVPNPSITPHHPIHQSHRITRFINHTASPNPSITSPNPSFKPASPLFAELDVNNDHQQPVRV